MHKAAERADVGEDDAVGDPVWQRAYGCKTKESLSYPINAVWAYPEPVVGFAGLQGNPAFYLDLMDACSVAGELGQSRLK
jgi:hypothetical protein